jgi:signal transduction histidine kinase
LAIRKAFIEAHGGTIWAESSTEGTTISFSLPLASLPSETEAMEFLMEERR